MASSPSSKRWKNEGRCAVKIVAPTSVPSKSGLEARRVIAAVDMVAIYIAVRSKDDRRPALRDSVRARGHCGGAGSGSVETLRANRHRLPYIRGGRAHGPAVWVAAHLRPGAGRDRAEESRPGTMVATFPQPADRRLASGTARVAPLLELVLRVGDVHIRRSRSGAHLGLHRPWFGALGRGWRSTGAMVGVARGASRPGRSARGRRSGARLAPCP